MVLQHIRHANQLYTGQNDAIMTMYVYGAEGLDALWRRAINKKFR